MTVSTFLAQCPLFGYEKQKGMVFWKQNLFILRQVERRGHTNPRHLFAWETKFCTVASNICELSVWKLLYVNFLAPVIGGGFWISVYPGPTLLLLLYHYNHPSSLQNISWLLNLFPGTLLQWLCLTNFIFHLHLIFNRGFPLVLQFIIFLWATFSLMLSHFRHTRSLLHIIISEHMNNVPPYSNTAGIFPSLKSSLKPLQLPNPCFSATSIQLSHFLYSHQCILFTPSSFKFAI